jgi:hypothetical protein
LICFQHPGHLFVVSKRRLCLAAAPIEDWHVVL